MIRLTDKFRIASRFSRLSRGIRHHSSSYYGAAARGNSVTVLSREENLERLRRVNLPNDANGEEKWDVIVIGGGATGSGAALDAASRGLKTVLLEREDFASGTSSRSTKLLWGGSRYLVNALINLFSSKLLTSPIATIKGFLPTFKMVRNCIGERQFLLDKQSHLTSWLPIAVYHQSWIQWPPPFGYPPAALGPLGVYSLFFKFYDFLAGFKVPPSHIMSKSRAARKFKHLDLNNLKYCSVFYEGVHDDARTNLSIAQTASLYGAAVANYAEVISLLREDAADEKKVTGVVVQDTLTGERIDVRAKSVVFAGGPFTDELLQLEDQNNQKVVKGASGVHIVLPGYYAPAGMGLVDMNTSDGRFLFFLPWEGHVVVGTTDRKAEATMRPEPEEVEIQWILKEASKYLNPELMCRRSDVLSAWCGVRPLAEDPNAGEGEGSRDHVICHHKESGVIWISGGKWTTYREMAEEVIDKAIEVHNLHPTQSMHSRTRDISLIGSHGFSNLLPVRLVQEYGVAESVATRLAKAYGGRAFEVMRIEREELQRTGRGVRLTPGFPILESEIIYACRQDWAVHAEDFLARRTRLAFLNKDLALSCIPRVVSLMARELNWNEARQAEETQRCIEFLKTFGGNKPMRTKTSARMATYHDITEAWQLVCTNNAEQSGKAFVNTPVTDSQIRLNRSSIVLVSNILEYPLTDEELDACFDSVFASKTVNNGEELAISLEEFDAWWNGDDLNPNLDRFRRSMSAAEKIEGGGAVFG